MQAALPGVGEYYATVGLNRTAWAGAALVLTMLSASVTVAYADPDSSAGSGTPHGSDSAPGPESSPGAESPTEDVAAAGDEASAGPKALIKADGTYVVGTDILPGTYASAGPIADGACYWKRLDGSTILDNALTKKPQVVQIEPTDSSFMTNDCQQWQLVECQPQCAPLDQSPQEVLGDVFSFLGPGLVGLPPAAPPG